MFKKLVSNTLQVIIFRIKLQDASYSEKIEGKFTKRIASYYSYNCIEI